MKKPFKVKPIKRGAHLWLVIFLILALLMFILTMKPVADVVAPMVGMQPGELQDTAWNVIIMSVGAAFVIFALTALAAVPILGVVMIILGAALVIAGAYSLFKSVSNASKEG